MQRIDARIVSVGLQFTRKNQVPIENAANRVADRLIEVVAFNQDGKDTGDGSFFETSGSLT